MDSLALGATMSTPSIAFNNHRLLWPLDPEVQRVARVKKRAEDLIQFLKGLEDEEPQDQGEITRFQNLANLYCQRFITAWNNLQGAGNLPVEVNVVDVDGNI